jgi:phospholipid/cholesterol/gamma-HCH transport system permease protein
MQEPGITGTLQAIPDDAGGLQIRVQGDWRVQDGGLPGSTAFVDLLDQSPRTRQIAFDCSGLGQWDTALLIGLDALLRAARARDLAVDATGLPDGVQHLLRLAAAVPEREGARRDTEDAGPVANIGQATLDALAAGRTLTGFLGELSFSAVRLLRGRARFNGRDLLLFFERTGANAFPIVSLIAFLVGVILAFVGIKQLEQFGAGIYVADLVAVAMVREMAALMTGIIMAGRSGAAFAAELGTMKVNEEIDALLTLGISPMDYLVLPRTIALVVMMPLLAVYAGLVGMVGGAVVSLVMLDVNLVPYLAQTRNAIDLNALLGGLLKAVIFGIVIAISGCQQGLACGGSAMAVGQATTRAVVMAILLIVVTASVLTVIYTVFGI